MGRGRRLYKHHLNCLIALCVLTATVACADNSDKELDPMTDLSSRDARIEYALTLSKFAPSDALGRPLAFDEARFKELVGEDVLITSFRTFMEGPDLIVSAYAKRDDALAVRLEISQIAERKRVLEKLRGSFDLISAPIEGLEAVSEAGVDRVARLSRQDTFAVASRGDIMVTARTGSGYTASEIAAKTLRDIFGER